LKVPFVASEACTLVAYIVAVPAVEHTAQPATNTHVVAVHLEQVTCTILPTFNLLLASVNVYSQPAAIAVPLAKVSVVINPIAALHVTAALAAVAVTTPSLLVGNTNEDFVILL